MTELAAAVLPVALGGALLAGLSYRGGARPVPAGGAPRRGTAHDDSAPADRQHRVP